MNFNKVNILAAMMARSNMGLPRPEAHELKYLFGGSRLDLDSAVNHLCSPYMESDEHEDIFMEEAQAWVSMLNELGEEKARKTYPWAFKEYDEAEAQHQA